MSSSRYTLNILLAPVGSPQASHRATSALCLLLPHLSRCTRVALEDVPAAPPASFPSLSFDARVLHVGFSLHAPSPVDADADATRLFASGALSGVLAVLDARGVDDVGPAVDDATRAAAALVARHGLPTGPRDAPAAALLVLNASADAMARFASRAQPAAPAVAVDFMHIAEPAVAAGRWEGEEGSDGGGGGSGGTAAGSDAASSGSERVGMHVGLIVSRLLAAVLASLDADAAAATAAASASGGGGSTGGLGVDAALPDEVDGGASGASGAAAGSTSPRSSLAQHTLRIPAAFTGRRAFGVDVCASRRFLRSTRVRACST
jgi:hypothetical protein